MAYCIYLRKSRADIELEEKGEGETLSRHRKILENLAQKKNYEIGRIYSEIVSGESISTRPEIQRLLCDIENNLWEGVLVMEIERLARGDTIDQGIIAKVFRESGTSIITPNKTYDPKNEFDEEYFEFSLFMSRREYKTINRRIQRGRIASVKEGKYISPIAPFGFDRIKSSDGKGYVLCKNPTEAPTVFSIYQQYLNGHSVSEICNTLNLCGIKPRKSDSWSESSIRDILKNPANAGFIRWARRKNLKVKEGKTSRKICNDYIIVRGLHEEIVTEEDYNHALEILKSNRKITVPSNKTLKNPLSGLIFCKNCGKPLSRSANKNGDLLICKSKGCPTVSAKLSLIEASVISEIKEYYHKAFFIIKKSVIPSEKNCSEILKCALLKQQKSIDTQLKNAYTLVEKGIYSDTEYLQRRSILLSQKERCEKELERYRIIYAENEKNFEEKKTDIFRLYNSFESAEKKNRLLKGIIQKIIYKKDKIQGEVALEIFVKI